MTTELDRQIESESDVSRRYWLKQARFHLRSAETHKRKGNAILGKLKTWPTGQPVIAGVKP